MSVLAGSRTLKELLADWEWELPASFIDVVFLLLIFFMCCSSFRALEQRLEVNLPPVGAFRPPPPPIIPPELVIRVSALDPAGATPRYQVLGWQTSDPSELAGRLAQVKPGSALLVIDGASGCPFRHVLAAADACARANHAAVSFRLPPPGV